MISDVLKNLRKNLNLSQEELSKQIGIPRYTISDWEQGRLEPNCNHLRTLCIFFNISADELLEIETEKDRQKIQINNSFNNSKNIKVKIK